MAAFSSPPSFLAAHAAEVRTYFSVAAIVTESVSFRVLKQARELVVTSRDIERGYVVAHAGTRLEIKGPRLCVLEFRPVGRLIEAVRISTPALQAEFGAGGGTLVQEGLCSATIEISYVFVLAPGVRPGMHPWPVSLTVLPM